MESSLGSQVEHNMRFPGYGHASVSSGAGFRNQCKTCCTKTVSRASGVIHGLISEVSKSSGVAGRLVGLQEKGRLPPLSGGMGVARRTRKSRPTEMPVHKFSAPGVVSLPIPKHVKTSGLKSGSGKVSGPSGVDVRTLRVKLRPAAST